MRLLLGLMIAASTWAAGPATVAANPPMGWNSWDCYGTAVTEAQVKANADYMAKHLKQHGGQYVVVDIQWSEPHAQAHGYRPDAELAMDEYGRLIPAVNRFPSSAGGQGFKPLADYVHSLGLRFGIHIMRGIPRRADLCYSFTTVSAQSYDETDPESFRLWTRQAWRVHCRHIGPARVRSCGH